MNTENRTLRLVIVRAAAECFRIPVGDKVGPCRDCMEKHAPEAR